jgi:hypothetical protein
LLSAAAGDANAAEGQRVSSTSHHLLSILTCCCIALCALLLLLQVMQMQLTGDWPA